MKSWSGKGEFPTLGHTVLEWTYAHLPSPTDDAKPLVFTQAQARNILQWYRIDPISGRVTNRRMALEEAKGYGKSPWAAAIALVEFAGPCRFDGWDADGEPVARPQGTGELPPPWVQIAAVSEDQTDNTYRALYEMLTARDQWAAKTLRIDQGKTRLMLRDRPGNLEPVTASAGSREGQRLTFAVLDETHLWTSRNGGTKLANTLRRNVAKMSGRTIETTNAPLLGEKSVAEQTGADADSGEPGILHIAHRPSIEPMPDWKDERLLELLGESYGEAPWIDRRRILAEIRDPATDWNDALRFYFNVRTRGAGRAVDPRTWNALAKPRVVESGSYIGLGFDGSVSRDATYLRGCTTDGYSFIVDKWERPPGAHVKWEVNRLQVEESVARAFERYRVGLMLCDPPFWRTEIEGWMRKYDPAEEGRVLKLETSQYHRFAPAVDRWLTGIREGTHLHDGDESTTRHVLAASLRKVRITDDADDGRTKYVLIKGDDHGRIDGAVADVLAYEAAMTMPPDEGPSVYETRGVLVLGR